MTADPPPKPRTSILALLLKVVISVVLAVVVLAGAGRVFEMLASQKVEPPREEPIPSVFRVETYRIQRQPMQRYIAGFGTAGADREVVVGAEVAGRIAQTEHLRVGDHVDGGQIRLDAEGKSQRSPGTTILRIDPQTYEERVNQAQAKVTQDQVDLQRWQLDETANQRLITQQQERLATAQRELDRAKRLFAMGSGSEVDVSRAELETQQYQEVLIKLQSEQALFPVKLQQLETQATTHKSELALAMLELEKAHVRAPFSAIISQVQVEEGQYVRPGEPLVRLTNADLVVVPVPVALEDAAVISALLATGQETRVELVPDEAALFQGGLTWEGRVARISPIADERTRTVQVFVEVDNRDAQTPLRPGTFVYVRIAAEVIATDVGVLVPRDSIVNGAVFVVGDDSNLPAVGTLATSPANSTSPAGTPAAGTEQRKVAQRVEVQVVRSLQSFALVTGDLPENAQVVMTNLDIVAAGSLLETRRVHTLQDELARLKVAYLSSLPDSPAVDSPATDSGNE